MFVTEYTKGSSIGFRNAPSFTKIVENVMLKIINILKMTSV